jgi:hypothetical protein
MNIGQKISLLLSNSYLILEQKSLSFDERDFEGYVNLVQLLTSAAKVRNDLLHDFKFTHMDAFFFVADEPIVKAFGEFILECVVDLTTHCFF